MSSEGSANRSLVPSAPGPSTPLTESYTHHSPTPTAVGPYILGVDEAGRGPVLGPLVYGVAYCPVAYKEKLEKLGFADSKTLNAETRSSLLETLSSDPSNLGWSVRVISPQAISSGMIRKPPMNLNQQSQEATILLIREVLARGIELTEVYVDALGTTTTYEKYLSGLFPGISFTVTTKADAKFKIVGAASVAAKVTRDACVEGWYFEENPENGKLEWSTEFGSGYPSGKCLRRLVGPTLTLSLSLIDPNTRAWLEKNIEPTFGFPKVVRFSWTTVKVLLENNAHPVKWNDEGQVSLIKAFETSKGLDKDRCLVTKDLQLSSVSTL
ncbi:Ribonuclease H2 subunit A [Leucoagaricus sp. SymC.cos]|nr:Ribonuclease H2 subunit A [Leucoagaricus sp. SymC.cos]